MFDAHIETLYIWVGVGLVSVAVLAVVTGLPSMAPPDGAGAATTIDEITTSPPGSVATREIHAEEWSVTTRHIGLRSDSGMVHETLLSAIVPAFSDTLRRVLRGSPPGSIFGSRTTFSYAIDRAQTTESRWRPAPDRMTVRHLEWRGIDVTLVG
jgi:hypothetical protein